MATRIAQAFTNKFGHVINVGDKVIVVAEGYNHSIHTYEGVYIGFVRSTYFGEDYSMAQVMTTYKPHYPSNKKTRIATLRNNLVFLAPKE